jgi:hypothetical protein
MPIRVLIADDHDGVTVALAQHDDALGVVTETSVTDTGCGIRDEG